MYIYKSLITYKFTSSKNNFFSTFSVNPNKFIFTKGRKKIPFLQLFPRQTTKPPNHQTTITNNYVVCEKRPPNMKRLQGRLININIWQNLSNLSPALNFRLK